MGLKTKMERRKTPTLESEHVVSRKSPIRSLQPNNFLFWFIIIKTCMVMDLELPLFEYDFCQISFLDSNNLINNISACVFLHVRFLVSICIISLQILRIFKSNFVIWQNKINT